MLRKSIAAIVLGLAALTHAAELIPPKQTIIQVGGGGSDPTKVPLAGGTMTGSLVMGTGPSSVVLSTSGVITSTGSLSITSPTDLALNGPDNLTLDTTGLLIIRSTNTSNDLPIQFRGRNSNSINYFVTSFINTDGGGVALLLSTTPVLNPSGDAPALVLNNPGPNQDISLGIGPGYGTLELRSGEFLARIQGFTTELAVNQSSITLNASTNYFGSGQSDFSGNTSLKLPGSVGTGSALCKNASGLIKTCTSAVGVGGTCTCP